MSVSTRLDLTPIVIVGAAGVGLYVLIKSIKGPILPDIDLSFGIPGAIGGAATDIANATGIPQLAAHQAAGRITADEVSRRVGTVAPWATPGFDLFRSPTARALPGIGLFAAVSDFISGFFPTLPPVWRPGEMVIQPYRPIYTAGGVVQGGPQGEDPRQAYWDQGGYRGGGL